MPVTLNYEQVRALAKKLKARSGAQVKLTQVYEDIASVVGRKPDAMMHQLKTEANDPSPVPPVALQELLNPSTFERNGGDEAIRKLSVALGKAASANVIATELEFENWGGPNGPLFRKLLKFKHFTDGSFVIFDVGLEATVYPAVEGGEFGPEDKVWAASLGYYEADGAAPMVEPRDVDEFGFDGSGAGTATLAEAIMHVRSVWMAKIDAIWNGLYDDDRVRKLIEDTGVVERVKKSVALEPSVWGFEPPSSKMH